MFSFKEMFTFPALTKRKEDYSVKNMDENSVVLSFHDTLLRKSDVSLLEGPYWLNDNLISFYFEYLAMSVFRNEPQLLFISPEVTQCLKVSPNQELGIFLDPLQLKKREFVFMALNDCTLVDSPGGSHWSLLVFSKPESAFFHFDSAPISNSAQARKLAFHLSVYFPSSAFNEEECLQQENSYDCGIHLLCNVENAAQHCARYGKVKGCGKLKMTDVVSKRKEILQLIEHLAKK